jgi:hypothetical protein
LKTIPPTTEFTCFGIDTLKGPGAAENVVANGACEDRATKVTGSDDTPGTEVAG